MLREALALAGAAMTAAGGLTVEVTAHAASSPVIIDTPHGPVMLNGLQAGGDQAGQLLASIGSRPTPMLSPSQAQPFDACGANSRYCTNAKTYQVRNAPCNRNCDQISGGDIINVLEPVDYDINGPYAWWGITNDVQLSGGGHDDMCVIYADLDVDGSPTLIDDRLQGTQDVGTPQTLSFTVQAPIPGASAFATGTFLLADVRLIRPKAGARPDVQAQPFLVTVKGGAVWIDPNWQADATQMYRRLQRDDPEAQKQLVTDPQPAALLVTAGGKPKLAVYGDVTFVTNREVSERSGSENFSLFASTLDWLAERPTSIGVEPRNVAVYLTEAKRRAAANDPDLAPLRDRPEFRGIVTRSRVGSAHR